jgi:hypothetical protein
MLQVVPYENDKTREQAIESFSKANLSFKQIHDIIVKPTLELMNLERPPLPQNNNKEGYSISGVY